MTINDIEVTPQNIVAFSLREWIFSQSIEMECSLLDNGTFIEYFPLFEEVKIYIELSIGSEHPQIFNLRMNDFEIDRSNNGSYAGMIHFNALPDVDNYFMTMRARTFRHKVTSDIVKEVFSNINVKTDIRVESNDVQDWYQLSIDDYTFIRHLLKRSYIDQEDLPFIYMNRDNSIVYTSLKTECAKNSVAKFVENGFLASPDAVVAGMKDKNDKTIYFAPSVYRKNISSSLNKIGAYGTYMTYFDNTRFRDKTINFNYKPFTTYGNMNTRHIGKTARSDKYSSQPAATHKNYFLGVSQNIYISTMFFSDYTQITIPATSTIKLFDRISVEFPDSLSNSQNKLIDKTNSGDYIIGGIAHSFTRDTEYNMSLVLFRNGINEPEKLGKPINMVTK